MSLAKEKHPFNSLTERLHSSRVFLPTHVYVCHAFNYDKLSSSLQPRQHTIPERHDYAKQITTHNHNMLSSNFTTTVEAEKYISVFWQITKKSRRSGNSPIVALGLINTISRNIARHTNDRESIQETRWLAEMLTWEELSKFFFFFSFILFSFLLFLNARCFFFTLALEYSLFVKVMY